MTTYLEKAYEITNKLQKTASRLDKISILKQYKDDPDIKSFLSFLLNNLVVTGLSTKKMKHVIKTIPNTTFNDLNEIIDYLAVNNTGTGQDIVNIQAFIKKNGEEYSKFITEVVTKKLKIGVTAKTVNSVFGGTPIPTFAVQLAESYKKCGDKIDGELFVTMKLDGNRCIAINEESGVKFFTRKGKQIEGLIELEEDFKDLPYGIVFDGEILLPNEEGISSGELFRKTQQIIRKDGEKRGLLFYIFDSLSMVEFNRGVSDNAYISRRNYLDTYINDLCEEKSFLKVLPILARTTDKEVITDLLEKTLELGYEGLMINTANGLYVTKRTVDLQKCKAQYDVDLLVTDVVVAIDGKYKDLVGSLIVEYKGNSVGVGSGLNDSQRKEWAENPEKIIGKVIQVQYTEESADEEGNPSLRFPRFKGVREDKTSDDVNYE